MRNSRMIMYVDGIHVWDVISQKPEIMSGIVPKVLPTLLRKSLRSLEFNSVGYADRPGICQSLHSWGWDYKCMPPPTQLVFVNVGPEDQTQDLMLV